MAAIGGDFNTQREIIARKLKVLGYKDNFQGKVTCNTGGSLDSIFTLGEVIGVNQCEWERSDHSWLKVKVALFDNSEGGDGLDGCPKHYVDMHKAKEMSRTLKGSREILNAGWPFEDVADTIWKKALTIPRTKRLYIKKEKIRNQKELNMMSIEHAYNEK